MHRLLSIAPVLFLCLASWTIAVSEHKLFIAILFLAPYIFIVRNTLSHGDEPTPLPSTEFCLVKHRTSLEMKVARSCGAFGLWCAGTLRTILLPLIASSKSPFILLQIVSLFMTSNLFFNNWQTLSFTLVNIVAMLIFAVMAIEIPLSMCFLLHFVVPILFAIVLIIGLSMKMRRFNQQLLDQYKESEIVNSKKSALLSTIAHEIRTPLSSMLGCADILHDKCLEMDNIPRACIELIETMRVAGTVLLETLNSILDYVKFDLSDSQRTQNDPFLRASEFDLNFVVNDVLSIAKIQAGIKNLSMDIQWEQLDPNCCIICNTDPIRLKQVLLNVMNNAVKFTVEGGVKLSISKVGRCTIRFKIIDSGVGISPEFVPRLFSPFSRGSDRKEAKTHGTGLGLTISKHIVSLMRGTIQYSANEIRGSTFTIEVPIFVRSVRASAPCNSNTAKNATSGHNQHKLRALLVDDNPINRKVMHSMLETLLIDHKCVSSGEEALQAVGNQEFQLILSDISMSGMSGIELVTILRREFAKTGKNKALVYFISGADERELSQDVLCLVDGYCQKPLRLSKLKEIINQCATKLISNS